VAPSLSGFIVYATSISVYINLESNPNGANISVSSVGSFDSSASTIGIAAGNPTNLTLTGLIPNTAYTTMQLGAFENSINASTQSPAGPEFSTTTAASPPTITSFRVFTTSIQIVMGLNGNPTGTPLMISTGTGGHYAVTNSSVGIYDGTTTALTIVGLTTATIYSFQAGARDSTSGAATQTTIVTLTTSTLAAPPTITSFRVFTTSIQIVMGLNGNPTGTPLMISTGTGNHYAVANSSVGIYDTVATTLTIVGLTTATVYSFQAGVRDRSSGAATQTTIVTLTTSTLSTPPTITSFRVFATSVSVTLGGNGNPVGTTLTISTGTSGHYAVSNSSKGVVGSSDVTLVIVGLTANTGYGFQAGTNDSAGSAATQTTIIAASTGTLAVTPTVTSYRIFATSATITLGANSNPDGTAVAVSTGTGGHYAVANSSAGIFSSGSVTLVITGLTANTGYIFQAGTNDRTANASTQTTIITDSTMTLAANPAITSFRVFTTSISVTIGANGNPVGTTLTISTGTGGHYAVSNSSKGIVGSGDVTLVISNLPTAVVYGFMAGTNDSAANASTQTTIITASTATLAVTPSLSGFIVYATSISVYINPETNANGCNISVSSAGSFDSLSSTIGIVSGNPTQLTLTGLTPNTAYTTMQIGAFESSINASTQSPPGADISTTTAASPPTITSFRVFTTSISVTLGANNNPVGTTLTISTGTGGHYAVSNSSKGLVGSSDVALVISNL
ncbi:MAG: hypothetical protein HYY63_05185, partial [Elusimicrobia bacterium]|nr:hypothetical protein [Elusimicrobiota bacterium]